MVPHPIPQLACTHLDISGALLRIGDEQAMREMLSMVKDLLATDIPKITTGLQSGDLAQVAGVLHSLKGCLPIFCTPSIGTLLEQSELSAKSGALEKTNADYRELGPALNQLADEISRHLSE